MRVYCKLLDIDCKNFDSSTNEPVTDNRSVNYNNCIETALQNFPDASGKDLYNLCSFHRTCEIDNVVLGQTITITAETTSKDEYKDDFKNNLDNSAKQNAYNNDTKYSSGSIWDSDYEKNYEDITTNLFDSVNDQSFNQQILDMIVSQNVSVIGGRKLSTVNLSEFQDLVYSQISNLFADDENVNDLATSTIEASTQVTESGLSELIMWIVYIVLIIAIVILLLWIINMFENVYTIIVS